MSNVANTIGRPGRPADQTLLPVDPLDDILGRTRQLRNAISNSKCHSRVLGQHLAALRADLEQCAAMLRPAHPELFF